MGRPERVFTPGRGQLFVIVGEFIEEELLDGLAHIASGTEEAVDHHHDDMSRLGSRGVEDITGIALHGAYGTSLEGHAPFKRRFFAESFHRAFAPCTREVRHILAAVGRGSHPFEDAPKETGRYTVGARQTAAVIDYRAFSRNAA